MSIVMKMENKYQEAFKRIINDDYLNANGNQYDLDVKLIEKLIDETTPQKPIISYPMGDCYYTCPCCGNLLIEKRIIVSPSGKNLIKNLSYCDRCGREVDWSGFDGK